MAPCWSLNLEQGQASTTQHSDDDDRYSYNRDPSTVVSRDAMMHSSQYSRPVARGLDRSANRLIVCRSFHCKSLCAAHHGRRTTSMQCNTSTALLSPSDTHSMHAGRKRASSSSYARSIASPTLKCVAHLTWCVGRGTQLRIQTRWVMVDTHMLYASLHRTVLHNFGHTGPA